MYRAISLARIHSSLTCSKITRFMAAWLMMSHCLTIGEMDDSLPFERLSNQAIAIVILCDLLNEVNGVLDAILSGTPARVGQVGRLPHLPRRWWGEVGQESALLVATEVHHTSIHGALQIPFVDALNLEAELYRRPTCYHRLVQRMHGRCSY